MNLSALLVPPLTVIQSAMDTLFSNSFALVITVLAGITLFLYYATLPPKELAHLPSIPIYKYVWAQLRGYSYTDQDALFAPHIKDSPLYRMFLVGRWNVLVSTPALAQKVLTNYRIVNKNDLFRKYPHMMFSKLVGKNIVTLATGDEWRAHRQLANPPFKRSFDLTIFGNSALELFKIIEHDQATSADGTKTVIHMNEYMQRLTLDMLGKALFGHDFQALAEPGGEMVARYNTVMREMFKMIYFAFPWLEKIFPRRAVLQDAEMFADGMMEVMYKKRAELDELRHQGKFDEADARMDLIQHLLLGTKDRLDEHGNVVEKALLDKQTLKNSFFIYTLAGHDTTSNALSTGLFLISKHQRVQDKLRAEVDAVMGTSDLDMIPTHEDLKQMPYLFAVIKEINRLYPPVNQIFHRILLDDFEIMPGYILPKDTSMGIDASPPESGK
ncbi:cytochrome P450 [Ramicandelaber brevisporus]|nr:cytochrome P450 [Ramicandelaber brevisporus]